MTNAPMPMGTRLRPKLYESHAKPQLPVTPGESPQPSPMDPDQPDPPSHDPSSPYCADDPPPLLNEERA